MIHAMRTMARAVAAASALLVPLSCCAPVAQAQTVQHARLSAQVVNNEQRTMLTGAAPLVARYGKDQGSLTATEPLQSMKLVLRRGAAEHAAMEDFLAQVQNPASASYHKWLTPEQFGQRFGASSDDIAAIIAWLQQQGFSVDGVSRSRTVVTFSGTEAQFQSAFQAEMHRYLVNDQVRIANADTPSVPAALAPAVVGIATLGNARFVPTHTSPIKAQRDAAGRWHKQDASAVKAQATAKVNPQVTEQIDDSYYVFVGPADFAQMYGLKSVWSQGYKGAGQSVAIVAESNIATSDVDAFRAAFNLPATKLNVTVIGDDPGLSYYSGAEGEAVLDVEWAGATAPEADINLLVAASTATDEGILIAAEYAIDNNLSPVLDLSWGACELGLQESGNQYFDDLWAQAAAQGISIIVASGDGGAVACDQNEYYAAYGQQINGMASTENSTAIGGTDFPINASKAGTYWSQTNDPTTLQSAKSYVPESVWNDSCASPDVLANVAAFGLSESTSAEICNHEYAFLNTVGGGGGVSLCTSSDGANQSSCTGGHDAPAWQQGISGIGATGKRHIPDVSFFAGAGTWASAYAFCEADASTDDSDCVNNQGVITTLGAGGTSFGAPAFAGIVALLNQQQGARQGNLNKYLYALAAKQFADPVQSASCQSADGNSSEGCTFHDVIQGSNAEPCKLRTLVDLTTQTTCTAQGQYDWVGIAAGYSAATGYDPATGLGSVNAANLLAAWSSATAADAGSVTTHTLTTATTQMYGSVAAVEINVKAAAGSAVPSGTVALMSSESGGSTLGVVSRALGSGAAHVQFNSLVPGTHHLYASYGGDASFGASTSTPTEFVVTRAATSLAASASNTSVVAPNSVTILAQIGTDSTAVNPTGTLVFTNHATGTVLGTTTLTSLTSSSGDSWSQASMKLPGTVLTSGDNVIDVSYAGDGNYLAAANASVIVHYTGAYSIASSSSSLDIDVSGSKRASSTITVGSGNGTKIDPASLLLACQGLSTTGVTCAFTAPVLDASGAASSTLTVTANNPQTSAAVARQPASPAVAPGAGTLALGGLLLLWSARQRRCVIGMFGMLALVFSTLTLGITTGCGSSSHKATSTAVTNQLSVSSDTASYGTAVTFTSTVSAMSNTSAPSGTVLFYDGSTPLGSATVSGGKAQLSVSTLAVGKHTITASYSGDSTFMPSASSAASVNVTLSTTLNVTVSDTSRNVAQLALPVLIH